MRFLIMVAIDLLRRTSAPREAEIRRASAAISAAAPATKTSSGPSAAPRRRCGTILPGEPKEGSEGNGNGQSGAYARDG